MNKTIYDVRRVIELNKPKIVIDKFIESYRSGLNEEDVDETLDIADEIFKKSRERTIENGHISLKSDPNKKFDVNERSITRMDETLNGIDRAVSIGMIPNKDYLDLQWILYGSKAGEGTPITYDELQEAFILASQFRASNWVKDND